MAPASVLPLPPAKPANERSAAFFDWLRHHRGLTEAMIAGCRYLSMDPLPALGRAPATGRNTYDC